MDLPGWTIARWPSAEQPLDANVQWNFNGIKLLNKNREFFCKLCSNIVDVTTNLFLTENK